jgi:hypothetical protein
MRLVGNDPIGMVLGVAGFDDDPASAPRLDPLRDPMLEIRSQFGRWNGR